MKLEVAIEEVIYTSRRLEIAIEEVIYTGQRLEVAIERGYLQRPENRSSHRERSSTQA